MIRRVIVSTVRKSSVTNAIAATAGRSKRSFSIRNNVSFTQSANINKISDIPNANRGVRPLSTTVNDSAIKEKNQTDKGKKRIRFVFRQSREIILRCNFFRHCASRSIVLRNFESSQRTRSPGRNQRARPFRSRRPTYG